MTDPPTAGTGCKQLTVVSTFSGAGGSTMGYKLAGYDVRLAVEWDDHAAACYRLNFPDTPLYHGDVGKLSGEEASRLARVVPGELDVFEGSPPCQGFSTAGSRMMSDDRNGLFREYVRLRDYLQPRAFIMENVPGMVLGKMKIVYLEAMRVLGVGYRVRSAVLDASAYGVPQRRRRLIFVGVREDLLGEPSFPAPTHARAVTVAEALGAARTWRLADLSPAPPDSGVPPRDLTIVRLGTWDKGTRQRTDELVPVDVDAPSDTVCREAGSIGNTLHGPAVVLAAMYQIGTSGPAPTAARPQDRMRELPVGEPSPTVLKEAGAIDNGFDRPTVLCFAPAIVQVTQGQGRGGYDDLRVCGGDQTSPTIGKLSLGTAVGSSSVICFAPAPPDLEPVEGVLYFNNGLDESGELRADHARYAADKFRVCPPAGLDAPAPVLMRGGIGGSAMGQAQVAVRGASPMASVLPAPALTGRALRIAEVLRAGRRSAGDLHALAGDRAGDLMSAGEEPARPVLKVGLGSAWGRSVVNTCVGVTLSELIPAPPFLGKALTIAEALEEGQSGSDVPKVTGGGYFSNRRLDRNQPAGTVTRSAGLFDKYPNLRHFEEVRGLSVGEVMRLQSFPDDYRWPEGTKWADGWARVGNSVPPLMMMAVAGDVRVMLLAPQAEPPPPAQEVQHGEGERRE